MEWKILDHAATIMHLDTLVSLSLNSFFIQEPFEHFISSERVKMAKFSYKMCVEFKKNRKINTFYFL